MSYLSFEFCIFIAALLLIYFILPKNRQWICLLVFSYTFYFFFSIKLSIFLLFTTISTYFAAIKIEDRNFRLQENLKKNKEIYDREQKKALKASSNLKNRAVIVVTLLLNFGILAFFKFYSVAADTVNSVSNELILPKINLILPLGISFYTFQAVGYLIDIYRGSINAQRNLTKFALFLSFFPQILQGPISAYSQLAHQLYEGHSFSIKNFRHGGELILWGIFKKLIIADRAWIAISKFTEDVYEYNGTTITFVVLLYALQLYADFSAGIDMSRGIAQMLGIDMIDNFRRPYFATSLGDYWRRWHISLGAWMKNYVFYPISLSKAAAKVSKNLKNTTFGKSEFGGHVSKVLPASFASLIIFLLVGIWHGAGWKYVVYGIWNGVIMMMSTLLTPVYKNTNALLHINETSFGFRVFRIFRTFILVYIGYVIDLAPNMRGAVEMFRQMVFNQNFSMAYHQISELGLFKEEYIILLAGAIVLFMVGVVQETHDGTNIRDMLDQRRTLLRGTILYVGFMSIVILGTYGPGYNPADFVYMQF